MRNNYKIIGDKVEIYTQYKGEVVPFYISLEDLERVKELPQKLVFRRNADKLFICHEDHIGNPRPKVTMLHRYIMEAPSSAWLVVFIDNDPTNLTRENLVLLDPEQSSLYRRNKEIGEKIVASKSMPGVFYDKEKKAFVARPRMNGFRHYLGYFDDPHEAFEAIQEAREALGYERENPAKPNERHERFKNNG